MWAKGYLNLSTTSKKGDELTRRIDGVIVATLSIKNNIIILH